MSTNEIYKIALDHFRSRVDIERINIILAWLFIKGYDIDIDHRFDDRKYNRVGRVKNITINGINIQGYINNDKGEIDSFSFYTKDGSCYSIDIDQWGKIALHQELTSPEIDRIVVKVS